MLFNCQSLFACNLHAQSHGQHRKSNESSRPMHARQSSLPQVGMVSADSRVVIIQTQSEHQGALAKPLRAKAEAAKPQHRKFARAVSFAVSHTSSSPEDACGDDICAPRGYAESQAEAPEALTDPNLQSPTRSQLSPASSGTEEDFLH